MNFFNFNNTSDDFRWSGLTPRRFQRVEVNALHLGTFSPQLRRDCP